MKNIIVIMGPTAVGKTKLSVELAKKINAEIINGDSMQVYKGMDIGTAKIKPEEKEGISHYLFDIADIDKNYTVYDYQKDCRNIIDEILKRNKKVIIVGGTGLYIKAALYNYEFQEYEKSNEYTSLTNEEILQEIKKYTDKVDIHINNRKRLVRLLNKYQNSEIISNKKDELLYDAIFIGLTTDRKDLYARINNRVDIMFEEGLLEEVKLLLKNYKSSKSLQTAIGYKEFIPYFNKEISLEDVKEQVKKNTRHYAKRQYTFFNNQFDIHYFKTNYDDFNITVEEVYNYVKSKI